MPAATLVVLNPKARRGADRFGRLEAMLRSALGSLGPLEVERTRGPRDAVRLAREAARAGVRQLVVGGGDGTLSEVATGVIDAGLADEIEIGLLPLGSGCDFARSLGTPRRVADAVALLRDGARARVDAGRVWYRDHEEKPRAACFVNEAGFGLSGLTVALVNRAGKRFGPTLSFALGTVGAIARGAGADVWLRVDGRVVFEGEISLVVCANGRAFGSGMLIAPEASVVDGLLDVIVVERLGRAKLLTRFPSLYRGRHLGFPEVHAFRGRRIEAGLRSPGQALIDVDGEPLGELPLTVEAVPSAIRMFGLPHDRAPALAAR